MTLRKGPAFFGAEGDPDFDLDTATRVHRWMIEGGDTAEWVAKNFIFDQMQTDLEVWHDDIQRTIDEWALGVVEKALTGNRIRYADALRAGEPVAAHEEIHKALVPLAKDLRAANAAWTPQERAREARERRRIEGRFADEFDAGRPRGSNPADRRRRAEYESRRGFVRRVNPRYGDESDRDLTARGIPGAKNDPGGEMPLQQRQQLAAAYEQIQDMVASTVEGAPLRGVVLTSVKAERPNDPENPGKNIVTPVTLTPTAVQNPDRLLTALAAIYRDGGAIDTVAVDLSDDSPRRPGSRNFGQAPEGPKQLARDLNVAGSAFDLMTGLGMQPETALAVGAGAMTLPYRDLQQKWTETTTADKPRGRAYRRIEAGAQAAGTLLGPTASPAVSGSLAVARYAGKYGQEIENAIGPTAERTAMRHRGVERKPSEALQRQLNFLRENLRDPDGRTADRLARDLFVHGSPEKNGTVPLPGGKSTDGSPLRDYLTTKLPDPARVEFHLESGRGTPSHGVLIDRTGRIASEAVGLSEDHFLPFTARTMNRLKGGEYARTRAFGGPTTEDFRAALLGGARAFTVVSNSGTYTVEFADDFRGARRFNDKSARMVKTYANLLDTLQAETVGREVSEERDNELWAQASRQAAGNRAVAERVHADLLQAELHSPQLTQRQRSEAYEEAIARAAQQSGYADPEELLTAKAAQIGADDQGRTLMTYDQIANDQSLPTNVREQARTTVLGMVSQDRSALRTYQKAIDTETGKMRSGSAKLRLDGVGYAQALEAMKEQFPYYIADVKYTKPVTGSSRKRDLQYVRPGDNRPVRARIGFANAPNVPTNASEDGKSGKVSATRLYGRKEGVSQKRQQEQEGQEARALDTGQQASGQTPRSDSPSGSGQRPKTVSPAERRERIRSNIARLTAELRATAGELKNAQGQSVPESDVDTWVNALEAAEQNGAMEYLVTELPRLRSTAALSEKQVQRIQAIIEDAAEVGPRFDANTLATQLDRVGVEAATRAERGRTVDLSDQADRLSLQANFGPEYDPGRTSAQYEQTYLGLMDQAKAEGMDLPGPSDVEAINDALNPLWVDLGQEDAKPEQQAQARKKIELLLRARRLGRMMANPATSDADTSAEVTAIEGAPTSPAAENPGAALLEALGSRPQPERQPLRAVEAAPAPAAPKKQEPRGDGELRVSVRETQDPPPNAKGEAMAQQLIDAVVSGGEVAGATPEEYVRNVKAYAADLDPNSEWGKTYAAFFRALQASGNRQVMGWLSDEPVGKRMPRLVRLT